MTEKHDYDTPWKEVVEHYFPEFVAFFFPKAFQDIDWKRGYEFLDKELQKIAKDAETGRRYVDKLVKVWLKNGEDAWALIHADIQIEGEKNFSERMYIYNYRLYDRYRRHAASFAVIGYAGKAEDTGKFEKKLWDCEVRFRFPVVRLGDYAKDPESLEKSDNPFAVVVLAHLKTKATVRDSKKRMREKIALIRHLYRKGFSKQDIVSLFRFIDWVMFLPEKEDDLFWEEVSVFEKEGKMPYITSVERIGYKRGIQQGRTEQGQSMLARMIAKKFRVLPEQELSKLEKLGPDDLLDLGEQLLDFESLEAVYQWIDRRTA
ncbi:DUF4351 domain-containing protein [Desulfonema magnum]|uniref:DUF4351 n=1 Tax=Desulfonema magnum TaxID=45655 RepID=A0A975BLM3_9BACT|nr:DUF4351 domain-containing protein [Desulfonema magnum]QTA87557.1 DUF4351 [Desulfonema magnum]